MKLIATYKHNGKPNRVLVTYKNQTFRRIEMFTDGTIPPSPVWQEQIHTGEFHNVINSSELEKEFRLLA